LRPRDTDPPIRAKLRRDIDEPMSTKSYKDRLDAIRKQPIVLTEEPSREYALRDKDEPM